MTTILKEQSFQSSGCTTEVCKVKLGQLLNAEYIISGTINKDENIYHLTIRLLNVANGQVINIVKKKFKNFENADKTLSAAAHDITMSIDDRIHLTKQRKKTSINQSILSGALGLGGIIGFIILNSQADIAYQQASELKNEYNLATTSSKTSEIGLQMDNKKKECRNLIITRNITAGVFSGLIAYSGAMMIRYFFHHKENLKLNNIKMNLSFSKHNKSIGIAVKF
jgi:hypothetical protein